MSGTVTTKIEGEFQFEGFGSVIFTNNEFTVLDLDGNQIIGPLSNNRNEIIEYIKWLAQCIGYDLHPIQFRPPDPTRRVKPWDPIIPPLSPYVVDDSKIPWSERPIVTMNDGIMSHEH